MKYIFVSIFAALALGNMAQAAGPISAPNGVVVGSFEFSADAYAVNEDGGTVTITVTRTGDISGEASVHYATMSGTATGDMDYTETSGDLTFAPSDEVKTFAVAITNDGTPEGDENFSVALSSPVGAILGTRSTATVAISDDDPTPSPTPGVVQLSNISGRAFGQGSDRVSISGFIIKGGTGKEVLVRGIGPSLHVAGAPLAGAMEDPMIELHDSTGAILDMNDDWRERQEEIQSTGFAPSDDREAALRMTLQPGSYTVVLRGAGGSTGIGLVEVYELQFFDGEFANVSVRGNVLTDDNVLINGIILRGGSAHRILFRAIGPDLHNHNITGELQDPTLEVYDQDGVLRGSNDNWRDSADVVAIQATDLAPNDDRESAVLLTLPPGNYTSIVRGVNRTTGIALAEAFKTNPRASEP